jgi:hypothetical protein
MSRGYLYWKYIDDVDIYAEIATIVCIVKGCHHDYQ